MAELIGVTPQRARKYGRDQSHFFGAPPVGTRRSSSPRPTVTTSAAGNALAHELVGHNLGTSLRKLQIVGCGPGGVGVASDGDVWRAAALFARHGLIETKLTR
jgi:hypothetical protein